MDTQSTQTSREIGGRNETEQMNMTLSEEISELIGRLGITRYRAAKLAGLHPSLVYRFLKGQQSLSVRNVERLRDTLRAAEATPAR